MTEEQSKLADDLALEELAPETLAALKSFADRLIPQNDKLFPPPMMARFIPVIREWTQKDIRTLSDSELKALNAILRVAAPLMAQHVVALKGADA
jgi:hypothetical protein